MNRHSVVQGNNSQVTTFQFGYRRPKSVAILLLWLRSNRVVENTDTPFLLQIWTLSQNFLLEIIREPVLCHAPRIAQSCRHITGSLANDLGISRGTSFVPAAACPC